MYFVVCIDALKTDGVWLSRRINVDGVDAKMAMRWFVVENVSIFLTVCR